MKSENNKYSNILLEQNNTLAVKCNYFKDKEYGNLNTGYFDFKNSIVSVDIDDKYFNLTSGYRKKFSKIYKLAFGNPDSLCFNILDCIDEDTAYNDAYDIANILTENSDSINEKSANLLREHVRDFLIMLILHVKCSDFRLKTLWSCYNCLINCYNEDNKDESINKFLDELIDSYHCSPEIHELVCTNSRIFKNMNKNMINMIYNKVLSLLSVFQNTSLRTVSSQSDFCIKDFVRDKPKSLYITLSSLDSKIYKPYIKMILTFFMNKIKKYYNLNIFSLDSVLFILDEFQNSNSNALALCPSNRKDMAFKDVDFKNKINLPVISSREELLKECKKTLKPDTNKRMWYDIPEEVYMQHEEEILEPLFASVVPNDEETQIRINDSNDDNDDEDKNDRKLKALFKPTDSSSSVNKDTDHDKNKNNIEIMLYKEIPQKNMYYTSKNEDEINELLNVLSYEKFNKIMNKFKLKKQSQNLICILSGSAGTGKTESVRQMARVSKRHLVKYDATMISTGYIGVAPCKVKEIFDSYYEVVKNCKTPPILFLNEADGIFSRRIDLSDAANQVSCLDENRTQTVLLEALENFEGILIATTNNIINFDKAFERRFMFKILMEIPDKRTKILILNDKMPELNEDETQYIVNNFDLTGAQIDNISRRLVLKKEIKDNTNFDDIKKLCKEEVDNSFTKSSKPIGFK